MPKKKPSDFNEVVTYRPGVLLGRALNQLTKEYPNDSRNIVGKNLACLALAGFSVKHYGDIRRAAEAASMLTPTRDAFATVCRALGPSCAKKPRNLWKRIIDRFTYQIAAELEKDDTWANAVTIQELMKDL